MFDNLKDKLGIGSDKKASAGNNYNSYDDGYDDGYDDYGTYDDDYGYDSDYSRDDDYRGSRTNGPRLVSIDDVRNSTPLPNMNYDEMARRSSSDIDAGKSKGLDSLFTPTSEPAASSSVGSSVGGGWLGPQTSAVPTANRNLKVIAPLAYGDVACIVDIVKAGDVAVIATRRTPSELSKRILDFSFGVAAALEATVDCPGNDVYVVSRGDALSDAERQSLQTQGVL